MTLLGTGLLHAQKGATVSTAQPVDFAIMFAAQHSLKATTSQNFWMEGGSAELGINVWNNLAVAANFTGANTSSIGTTGVPLVLESFTIGPRYRFHGERRISVYAEGLAGFATGSRSIFPTSSGTVPGATSLAIQLGGGIDYRVTPHISIRAINAGYLRTSLPNGTDNIQNTLQLGAGIVFRFHP